MANELVVFTRQHFDLLKDAQRKLADLLPLMDKAERCGIECAQFREVAGELGRRFESFEREFMTPTPTR